MQVDRGRERLVKLEARIVGDAGEIDDRVVPLHGREELRGVADVALDDVQVRTADRQEITVEELDVVDCYLVAEVQKLRH